MKIVIDGQEVNIPPRGPAGPDGNPIGTIVSFMGTAAPEDYLACDGTQYSISQYPALAAFFQAQFGSKNHFGGDGTTTFAVPDLRNLFLRGYHGEAEDQLSGEVGEQQEATRFSNIGLDYTYSANALVGFCGDNVANWKTYAEKEFGSGKSRYINIPGTDSNNIAPSVFSSRPVNMAVLYCIKATESVPAKDVYSTEETRAGTWIDGKPLYRKTYVIQDIALEPPSGFILMDADFHGVISFAYGRITIHEWNTQYIVPCAMQHDNIAFSIGSTPNEGSLWVNYKIASNVTVDGAIVVEYTKTTD